MDDSNPTEPLLPSSETAGNAWRVLQSFVRKAPTHGARVSESLDYEPIQNELQIQRVRERRAKRHVYGYSGLTFAKSIVVVMTGLFTGLLALVISRSATAIIIKRNIILQQLMDDYEGNFAHAFAYYIVHSVIITGAAGALVSFWAPASAGAGVTLVIAYLNGNHIPNLLRFRTLVAKLVGTIAGIVSGLAVGPEGPMVHIGACVASNITYANCAIFNKLSCLFPCFSCQTEEDGDEEAVPAKNQNFCSVWDDLHEDSEHREFISAGAAAGLSAAFGAPIGGVLFSMEEACSFWSKKVAWRCFFAAIMAAFAIAQLSDEGDNGILVFSGIRNLSNNEWLFQMPIMFAVATLGGVLGAVFNHMRRALWPLRASRSRKFLRVGELAIVALICVSLAMVLSHTLGKCSRAPVSWPEDFKGVRFNCPPEEHNDLATMFLSVPDELLTRMFSVGREKSTDEREKPGFSQASLVIYASAYIVMMALGAGTCIPAGLFMPAIMLGSIAGLAAGVALDHILGETWNIQPGLYALICACAALAGVFRSAISLVVIVVEGTRGIDFLFGVIIAVVTANWVSSFIHHDGIYESELERDGNIFFLNHDPPQKLQSLTADQIMVKAPVCFSPVVPVQHVLAVLTKCTHNGFPVVEESSKSRRLEGVGQLEGLILRSQLLVLMRQQAFCDPDARPVSRHTTQQDQHALEREMRLFYRKSYTHHRYMATLDSTVQELDLEFKRLLNTNAAGNNGSGTSTPEQTDSATLLISDAEAERIAADTLRNVKAAGLDGVGDEMEDEPHDMTEHEVNTLQNAINAVGGSMRLCFDLRPYMNTAPLTVRKDMSAARCHRTFVTLGMRHLCVTNRQNRVVGIITRKDLDAAAGHGHWRRTALERTRSHVATSSSHLRPQASSPLTGLFSLLQRQSSGGSAMFPANGDGNSTSGHAGQDRMSVSSILPILHEGEGDGEADSVVEGGSDASIEPMLMVSPFSRPGT